MIERQGIMLSVRLMTYNHEPFIEDALNSIFKQEANFVFEIVIGDDFSTDNTLQIIKEFIQKNNKSNILWNLLKREKGDEYDIERQRVGRLANFYNILENCKGKYIALLDGDDYWTDPLKLQKQVDFLEENEEYSGSYTDTMSLNNGAFSPWRKALKPFMGLEDVIALWAPFHTSSFVFKANVLNSIDFNIFQNIQSGDLFIFTLVAMNGLLAKVECEPTVYRKNETGITNTSNHQSYLLHINRILLWLLVKEITNKGHDKIDEVIIKHWFYVMKTMNIPNSTILNEIGNREILKFVGKKVLNRFSKKIKL